MLDDIDSEDALRILDELKSRVKEKDDGIQEALEEIYQDDEQFNVDYLLGRTSGYLRVAVEINKMKEEFEEKE